MADKILLVDDDPETTRLISLVLKRQGYDVVTALEGSSALHYAQTEQPDLLLLDVMMPGMDGYQITRILRENPETTNIPILMFSAKNQVEDRVAGYESGVDDYLTKPIHPAELVARVKSLITRSKMLGSTFGEKGYTIGVLGAKGGIGVSTLVLNLAISFHQQSDQEVIAVELRPGHGSWISGLKLKQTDGLSKLLHLSPGAITTTSLNDQLLSPFPGVQLLTASNQIEDTRLISATEQLKKVVKLLPLLSPLVLLDLGAGDLLNLDEIVPLCDEVMILMHSYPSGILNARRITNELSNWGYGKAKPLDLIIMNHSITGYQTPIKDIEDFLESKITAVIPPAPEFAYQAETQAKPLLFVQPESYLNKQFSQLALKIINTLEQSIPTSK
jgi:DNA-binding response OmpR family regulator